MRRDKLKINYCLLLLIAPMLIHCASVEKKDIRESQTPVNIQEEKEIVVGDLQTERYLPQLKNKIVGVVANHTAILGSTHLVDSLLSLGINVKLVFSPEHGFRGSADAGEKVNNQTDAKTGLPIISLYGDNKKPTAAQLRGIDVLLFDIQDVGARFYTYISTLHYVMEAAAEQDIPLIVLDRPNPNGHYVDGPVLNPKYRSFVGLHPVPIVHGLSIGEYAQMVSGEKWLDNGVSCDLTVITCKNYSHDDYYQLKVAPSPNLPNMNSIYLYPSLCLFEGTAISVGRGTTAPFQQYGHPGLKSFKEYFTPTPSYGAKEPKLKGQKCYGEKIKLDWQKDLSAIPRQLNLDYLLTAYQVFPNKSDFFNSFFNLLAGNNLLKQQIQGNKTAAEIRESWKNDLEAYKQKRKKYLLYKDFE
ncbi:MAG: DUF1343 domain-containing protein [Vicingaceae bacterium]